MSAAAAHAEPVSVPPAVAAAVAADADADADAPVPAESAAAGSEFGAPAADTAAVQYDLHVSHPVVTPEVQTSIDAFRKVRFDEQRRRDSSAARRRHGQRRHRRRQSSSRPDGPFRDQDRKGEPRRDTRASPPLAPSDRAPPALLFLPFALLSPFAPTRSPSSRRRWCSSTRPSRRAF